MRRGYFEIGVYHPKTEMNIGTLWRSAIQLGAAGVFTIGRRYKSQSSDTYKTTLNVPLRHFTTFEEFQIGRPVNAELVGVEFGGRELASFTHLDRAVYLLGAEDHGLPQEIMCLCQRVCVDRGSRDEIL